MMTPVQITNALLANYAEVQNGLAYITGGLPSWWTVPTLPAVSSLSMVVVVELDLDNPQRPIPLDFSFAAPSGTVTPLGNITAQRIPTSTPDGAPLLQVVATTFQLQFSETGLHVFAVACEGHGLSVPLWVKLP
jgi:hypothetical protein